MTAPQGIDVKLVNVTFEIPPPRRRFPCISTNSKRPTPILHGISAHVKPGEFLGILGPSGSGKTTLLNLIAARSSHGPNSGHILFNDCARSARTKRKIGYVMQDDVFFSKLTVRETLNFTAQVRLSRRLSPDARSRLIDELLASLRLTGCQNVQVGDQQFDKGISGGERKRLNVANELLHNPALLLADECTSGLDAASAHTVISMLRNRCVQQGRTVITTIHQPSSQIFAQFTKILLLAEGHVIYFGPPTDILNYIQSLHLPCPTLQINPADLVLQLVTRQLQSTLHSEDSSVPEHDSQNQLDASEEGRVSTDYVDRLIQAWKPVQDSIFSRSVNTVHIGSTVVEPVIGELTTGYDGNGHDDVDQDNTVDDPDYMENTTQNEFEVAVAPSDPKSPTTVIGRFQRAIYKRTLDLTHQHHILREESGDKYETDWFAQISALTKRAVRQKRGLLIEKASLLNMVAVTLITALFWFQMEPIESTVEDRLGVLSFVGVYWAFQSTFSAIFSFPKEKSVLNKDRASGAYRLSAYIFAKSIVSFIAKVVFNFCDFL